MDPGLCWTQVQPALQELLGGTDFSEKSWGLLAGTAWEAGCAGSQNRAPKCALGTAAVCKVQRAAQATGTRYKGLGRAWRTCVWGMCVVTIGWQNKVKDGAGRSRN